MSGFINTIDELGDETVVNSIIDRSITEFKDEIITFVGNNAFNGCTALETVDLPNFTGLSGNDGGNGAFAGCTSLTNVSMPKLQYIKNGMFTNCTSLTSVSFPEAVLGTEINPGMGAFQFAALVSAHIPKLQYVPNFFFFGTSLKTADFLLATLIAAWAFANAPLETLILRNTEGVCTLGDGNALIGTSIKKGTGHIYVPSSLLEDYKSATNWSTFADQFRALEDYTVDGTITGELDESKI